MNRRSFFRTLATAAAGFTILPAATTYSRVWRAVAVVKPVLYVPNPDWLSAPWEVSFILNDWKMIESQYVHPLTPRHPHTINGFRPVRLNDKMEMIPAYIEQPG